MNDIVSVIDIISLNDKGGSPMQISSKAIIALVLLPLGGIGLFAASLVLLSPPSDYGIRCQRTPVGACEILQTRFLGFIGNTSFVIPQSSIAGAQTLLPRASAGGNRAGATFGVALVLTSSAPNTTYQVLSYDTRSAADSATARLNAYFNKNTEAAVSITDDLGGSIGLKFGIPALIVGFLAILRWWRFRKPARSGNSGIPVA
ncbi:MAG: hypothetical protein KGQ37_08360 [Hyphomicrobiales bacterium]|nr:hypothetical protein [Hyphomicrobiales bacterium]